MAYIDQHACDGESPKTYINNNYLDDVRKLLGSRINYVRAIEITQSCSEQSLTSLNVKTLENENDAMK